MEYLGFIINSENRTISLFDVKMQKIRCFSTEILNEDFPATAENMREYCFHWPVFSHLRTDS